MSPGADPDVYFPFSETEKRLTALHPDLQELLYGDPGDCAVGRLEDRAKPLLFSMARLDKVKNLTGGSLPAGVLYLPNTCSRDLTASLPHLISLHFSHLQA